MREKFSKEFKVQAVELVIKEGFSVKTVSTNIGIHPNNLYRWISEFEKYGKLAFLVKEVIILFIKTNQSN